MLEEAIFLITVPWLLANSKVPKDLILHAGRRRVESCTTPSPIARGFLSFKSVHEHERTLEESANGSLRHPPPDLKLFVSHPTETDVVTASCFMYEEIAKVPASTLNSSPFGSWPV